MSAFVVLAAALQCPAREGAGTNELASLRKAYEFKAEQVEWKYIELLPKAVADYTNSLNALEQAFARNGDLDGVVAVRKAEEQFQGKQQIPYDAVVQSPVELRALQLKFRDSPSVLDAARRTELARLTADYIARLEKMKETLTKEARIDEAVAVKEEIEKVRAAAEPAAAAPQPASTASASGAQTFAGHRYRAYSGRISWHGAKEACERSGGRLVAINGKAENDFVASLVPQGDLLWIGCTDEQREGDWLWTDESRLLTAFWIAGEAKNSDRRDYVAIDRSGNWRPMSGESGYNNGYVCEWGR